MSSKTVGSGLASLGVFIFFYYSAWIFVIPFLDTSHWLHLYFLDKIWAVRIPQILIVSGISVLALLGFIALLCSKKEKKA